jgi:hypothetical protein
MPLRIPWARFRLWWLIALVALVGLVIFGLMPPNPGVVNVRAGTGRAVTAGDTVEVHYVGRLGGTRVADWLRLGKEFDNSKVSNVPFRFTVGQNQVIRGWELGMPGMKVGGVRKIVIPPDYGYGSKGIPPVIPPNSTLIFEVELLQILPKPSQGGSSGQRSHGPPIGASRRLVRTRRGSVDDHRILLSIEREKTGQEPIQEDLSRLRSASNWRGAT